MIYIDNLKHDRFTNNMDSHFSQVYFINFDIIHHKCRGEPLQNLKQHYETILYKDFHNYERQVQNQAVLSAIKPEHDDISFEHDFINVI